MERKLREITDQIFDKTTKANDENEQDASV